MVDSILGDDRADTSHMHMFHLKDSNCSICREKTRRELEAKEKAKRQEAEALKVRSTYIPIYRFSHSLVVQKKSENKERPKRPRFPNLDPATCDAMERYHIPDFSMKTPMQHYDGDLTSCDMDAFNDFDDLDTGIGLSIDESDAGALEWAVDENFQSKTPRYEDSAKSITLTSQYKDTQATSGESWKRPQEKPEEENPWETYEIILLFHADPIDG